MDLIKQPFYLSILFFFLVQTVCDIARNGELMQDFFFPNWVNKFVLCLVGGALLVGGYLATCLFAAIHPTIVNVGHKPKQPVPFSHKLHAGQLKLDCRYCHNTVEKTGHAAVPPTATCGNCHGAVSYTHLTLPTIYSV